MSSPSDARSDEDGRKDISQLASELAAARQELAQLRSLLKSKGQDASATALTSVNGAGPGCLEGPGAPYLPPPSTRIRRRHTDLGSVGDLTRGRDSLDELRVQRRVTLFDRQLHHSLGLWFLLANQLQFDGEEEPHSPESSNHLTTVSVANDGRSSVATAAAAAVSVATAKSWTSVSATGGTTRSSSASLDDKVKPAVPRTRFRLVAAIPKGPAKLLEAEERLERAERDGQEGKIFRNGRYLKSETSIPLDSLDPTEGSATKWAAYGAHLKLQWMSKPKRVLVVFKLSHEARDAAVRAIRFLLRAGVSVYVEPTQYTAVQELLEAGSPQNGEAMNLEDASSAKANLNAGCLLTWTSDTEGGIVGDAERASDCSNEANRTQRADSNNMIQTIPEEVGSMLDVIFTLGGDGTVLWVCSLLGTVASVPPIVAISMGSLGFMTPFSVSRIETLCSSVISPERELPLLLRHRLQCRIVRKADPCGTGSGDSANVLGQLADGSAGQANETSDAIMVLNEVVIDRGMTASLTKLECYIDGNYVTVIQGDGLIVSTPTGSTAYNLAAGGSMVHPAVPCILFTPICPHTLSSRPLVFPEHVVLWLKVPADSRENLTCSFDGKMRTALRPGDSVMVYSCQSPVPMVCHLDASHDFFSSVKEGLDWNRRVVQSPPQKL